MRPLSVHSLLFILLVAAAPALAAAPPARPVAVVHSDVSAFWLVPGGGAVWLPNELGVEPHRPYVGGLFGIRLSSKLALEGRGAFIPKARSRVVGVNAITTTEGEGGLTWFLLGDRPWTPYLTAGAGMGYFHEEGFTGGDRRFEYGGGLGFRLKIGDHLALRADGRDLRYKVPVSTTNRDEYREQPTVFAGISIGFGGAPGDADRDGVPDKADHCPGTPVGARVDAAGCPIDSDGDGVLDGMDACDGTPRGAVMDARGCPVDSDQDGVPDGLDRCPGTPVGALVDLLGCPRDSDQDSVYDGIDQCPGTTKGCLVNANGCPTDADQDGVCDGIDECPDTPPEAKVDLKGCPIVVSSKETELLETGMIRLQDVNFDTGRATLRNESQATLDEVGNILARWPDLRVEIGGHTDSRGAPARNLALSRARAQAVLAYLLDKFPELDASHYTTAGYGSTRPIADNRTELGREKNRRVEFKVLNKEALRRVKEEQRLLPRE